MTADVYDPRARSKANRALLVGVHDYDHDEPLPGVRHNLRELSGALTAGGAFRADEVRQVSPARRIELLNALETAAEDAHGLLLLYFAGHARLNWDGGELFLMVGKSRRAGGDEPAYEEAVSWRSDVLQKLREVAARRAVDQVVVVLDCCYAGNALEEFRPGAVQPGRDRISVLAAVQVNRRIPAGDGTGPTPYTKELVRLLRDGVPGAAPSGPATVRLRELAAALPDAMRGRTTVHGDEWRPRHHAAESERDVLLAAIPGPGAAGRAGAAAGAAGRAGGADVPAAGTVPTSAASDAVPAQGGTPRPAARRSAAAPAGAVRRWLRRPRRALVPLVAACTVLAAMGGYGAYRWTGSTAVCPPPLELRLLTDPDVAPTLRTAVFGPTDTAPAARRAVTGYLDSAANRGPHGCRRSGISIAAPKSTDVLTGLAHASQWQNPPSTGDFRPQRDIGAQPDIWIPGSTVTYDQAGLGGGAQRSAAQLDLLGPVAYSPMVLAVPYRLSTSKAEVTGHPLADLVGRLRAANPGLEPVVLRADPEYTDSAQLATVGLYAQPVGAALDPRPVTRLERDQAALSPAPRSSYELMCGLAGADAALEDVAAVVVPEQVMAQFNDPGDATLPAGCETGTLSPRSPEYPSDVGVLDLPFVRVTWQGADRDAQARRAAVTAFYRWLTGPDGRRVFTDAGYRTRGAADGSVGAVPGGSWLVGKGNAVPDPQPVGSDVSSSAVTAALNRYRQARGPGSVLYLLDASTSMGKVWKGPGGAHELIAQSLDALGARDTYGVWTVAGSRPDHRELLPLGGHTAAATRARLAKAATQPDDAHPGAALTAALRTLADPANGAHPRLIVYLTDEEDDNQFARGELARLLRNAGGDRIPVDWVSLGSGGGCAAGKPGQVIAASSGGRCLDAAGTRASDLREEVARVGTGDAS